MKRKFIKKKKRKKVYCALSADILHEGHINILKSKYYKPPIVVPSSYSKTYENDLVKNGFKIVIYANHLLRASYPAMEDVAKSILKNQRSFEAEKKISPIKEVINLISS